MFPFNVINAVLKCVENVTDLEEFVKCLVDEMGAADVREAMGIAPAAVIAVISAIFPPAGAFIKALIGAEES